MCTDLKLLIFEKIQREKREKRKNSKRMDPIKYPYTCDECNRGLSLISKFKRHCKTADNGYSCLICEANFKYKCGRMNHYYTQHRDVIFECEHCDKLLSSKGSLRIHSKRMHKKYVYTRDVIRVLFWYI